MWLLLVCVRAGLAPRARHRAGLDTHRHLHHHCYDFVQNPILVIHTLSYKLKNFLCLYSNIFSCITLHAIFITISNPPLIPLFFSRLAPGPADELEAGRALVEQEHGAQDPIRDNQNGEHQGQRRPEIAVLVGGPLPLGLPRLAHGLLRGEEAGEAGGGAQGDGRGDEQVDGRPVCWSSSWWSFIEG